MKKEHERKKASDEEKFELLLAQKEQAAEDFSKTIRNVKMEQEDLLDRLTLEHNEALQKAKVELARLDAEKTRENSGIIDKRRDAEAAAWDDIDIMTEKNKNILENNIEKGLENKAELTK